MSQDKQHPYMNQIIQVQQYIKHNLDQPLNRHVLAHVAGYSIAHFHRVFMDYTGESAANYIRRLRLERAGRKLRMGAVDIMDVGLAAGYNSHAAFTKAFKNQYGISPREFRNLSCSAATAILKRGSVYEN